MGSNHSLGLAIDINPDANPQIDTDGKTVLVGNKWEPSVNPYSISRDSDVVKAFDRELFRSIIDFRSEEHTSELQSPS